MSGSFQCVRSRTPSGRRCTCEFPRLSVVPAARPCWRGYCGPGFRASSVGWPFRAGNKQPIVAEPPEPRNDAGARSAVVSTGNGLLVPRRETPFVPLPRRASQGPCRNPAESLRYDTSTRDGFVYLPGRDDHYSRRPAGSHLPAGLDPSIANPCRLLAGPKNLIAHRGEMQHIEALRGKFKFHIVLVSAPLFVQKIADGNESWRSRASVKLKPQLRGLMQACLVAALCYVAAKLGGALIITVPQTLWPLWPGCAVLVAVLLVSPRKAWPFLIPAGLAGFVLYDVQAAVPIASIAWLMLADLSEIFVTAWGVSSFLNPPRLDSLKAFAKYSVFTVFLGPLVTSSIGIQALNGDKWISWRINFLSEGLAFLTLTPAILGWVGHCRAWPRTSRTFRLEAAVLLFALVTLCYGMFVARETRVPPALLYSLVPFLLWSALRFGSAGAATSASIVALLSIWGALHGHGPFTETDPVNRVFSLQLFLLFTTVPFMLLAVLVEE